LHNLDKFEFILQKGTELGVKSFVPIISERVQRKDFNKHNRFEKIIKEASEQCERGFLPIIKKTEKFENALVNLSKDDLNLFCYERYNENFDFSTIKKYRKVNIFIGPEGGFTEKEFKLARDCESIQIVSLGVRVLRSETAALAVLAKVLI
jgi:16S rRNA (uracil1498-N3)-methyltransferase